MDMSACHHQADHAPSDASIAEALVWAEARCVAQGHRWTPPRKQVFELLIRQGAPAKAYDLMAAYKSSTSAKPTTIYRALEFLEEVQLAHRIPSLNAYVACNHAPEDHAAAFMICDCCGGAQEFSPKLDRSALKAASEQGFTIQAVALEVRGLCEACSGRRATASA